MSFTIVGTNLSDDNTTSVNVIIGGTECNVTFSNTEVIICDVGEGPAGTFDVVVTIDNLGYAVNNGSTTFTYIYDISGFTPTSGSLAGKNHPNFCPMLKSRLNKSHASCEINPGPA